MKLHLTGCQLVLVLCLTTQHLGAASYTLNTLTNGSGTVSRNPTNSTYPQGSVVTITANPSSGWLFSSWTGDENSTTNPLNVTMTSNKVVTANFQLIPTCSLTVASNGQGIVTLNPPGGTYQSNQVVAATAMPITGWIFLNWTGDASGNSNPLAVTLDHNKAITANFVQPASIDASPQNVSATLGDNVAFTVHAVGTPTLFYQWLFNGTILPGSTNAGIALPAVQLSQEGTYSIIVSNAYGVSSNGAGLSILNSCTGTNVVSSASEAALRNAILIGGLVQFCFNGTITLSNTIDITQNVTLDARGRAVTLSGDNKIRIFNVSPGVTFSITNLTLANGSNVGSNGAPSVAGLPGEAGAILDNGGTVQLTSCILSSNSATGGAAGPATYPYPTNDIGGEGRGGAIVVRGGSLLLVSVTFINNSCAGGPGLVSGSLPTGPSGSGLGGAMYATNGSLFMTGCLMSNNVCRAPAGGTLPGAAYGGALFQSLGNVLVTNSLFIANSASGGNSFNANGGFPRPASAYGGGIAAASGTNSIVRSAFSSNAARGGNAFRASGTGEARGGAVFSTTTLVGSDCNFSQNSALAGSGSDINSDGRGGAVYNSGLAVLNRCSFVSNNATGGSSGSFGNPAGSDYPGAHGKGGALGNSAQLNITNCTIALNSAVGGAGASYGTGGNGLGGGLYNDTGVMTAMNATIASNFVVAGDNFLHPGLALGANVAQTNGTLALQNSLVAYPGANNNAYGAITDSGFNICSDGSAALNGGSSFNFTDPRLKPLGNYGGVTLTMAIQPDGPAVDLAPLTGAPPTDQRGAHRPFGSGIDSGAYEVQQTELQMPTLHLGWLNGGLRLSFQAQPGLLYTLLSSGSLTNWNAVGTFGPFTGQTNPSITLDPKSQSTAFFRLVLE